METVYQCECGQWSRAKMKILTDGKAICLCGREMTLTQKDLKPLKNKLKSFDEELKEIWEKNKEPVQRHGYRFWDNYAQAFVKGCRRGAGNKQE
jgi:hypothetical protein